jgi:hypothetical protein
MIIVSKYREELDEAGNFIYIARSRAPAAYAGEIFA